MFGRCNICNLFGFGLFGNFGNRNRCNCRFDRRFCECFCRCMNGGNLQLLRGEDGILRDGNNRCC